MAGTYVLRSPFNCTNTQPCTWFIGNAHRGILYKDVYNPFYFPDMTRVPVDDPIWCNCQNKLFVQTDIMDCWVSIWMTAMPSLTDPKINFMVGYQGIASWSGQFSVINKYGLPNSGSDTYTLTVIGGNLLHCAWIPDYQMVGNLTITVAQGNDSDYFAEWSSDVKFYDGDGCTYNGQAYRAIADNCNIAPGAHPDWQNYWDAV
ncbi:MAG: hypothetical protein LLF76_02420 [Planctomycetaceae bacterium]|nr:hypothetical protein [Planctomycetaceae bacterium]